MINHFRSLSDRDVSLNTLSTPFPINQFAAASASPMHINATLKWFTTSSTSETSDSDKISDAISTTTIVSCNIQPASLLVAQTCQMIIGFSKPFSFPFDHFH